MNYSQTSLELLRKIRHGNSVFRNITRPTQWTTVIATMNANTLFDGGKRTVVNCRREILDSCYQFNRQEAYMIQNENPCFHTLDRVLGDPVHKARLEVKDSLGRHYLNSVNFSLGAVNNEIFGVMITIKNIVERD